MQCNTVTIDIGEFEPETAARCLLPGFRYYRP